MWSLFMAGQVSETAPAGNSWFSRPDKRPSGRRKAAGAALSLTCSPYQVGLAHVCLEAGSGRAGQGLNVRNNLVTIRHPVRVRSARRAEQEVVLCELADLDFQSVTTDGTLL